MNEDDSGMEWEAATPPKPFNPYSEQYMPGGWPAEPPPPTTNAFARPADPGFFLPAARRVCRGIASITTSILTVTIVTPAFEVVRSYNARQRRRRIATYNKRPQQLLRDSPFRRAIKYKEGTDYDTIRSTPNPFRAIGQDSAPEAAHQQPLLSPNEPQPARPAALARFKRPRRKVHWTPQSNPAPVPERNPLFYEMPTFDPPRQDTPRVMSPRPDLETPPSCGNLALDEVWFPNLRPDGIRHTHKSNPTPPDSPSTQLVAELKEKAETDDGDSDVSSDLSDSWMPMGTRGQRRRDVKNSKKPFTEARRKLAGYRVTAQPRVATKAHPITEEPNTQASPEHMSRSDSEKTEQQPLPSNSLSEHTPTKPPSYRDLMEHTPSKSPRERDLDMSLSNDEKANLSTPQPPTPASDESDISSTVPWSPRDDLSLSLADFKTPTPPKPTPSTPQRGSPSPPLDFHRLHIAPSRPVTPEKQKYLSPKADHHSGEKTVRRTRAQKKQEEFDEAAKGYKDLTALDAEWEARVKDAVKKGHGRLTASDFSRVVPFKTTYGTDNWLNDEVINEYLNLIVAHGKKQDRAGQAPSHHAFSSFFYNKLVKEGPDSVKRWATRGKIGGKNLLQTKQVYIPINSGAHWTLAVVSGENKTISYYNSLPGSGRSKLEAVKTWVKNELGSAFKEEEWTFMEGESPMQANSDDCGVFTITSARQLMLGYSPMSYGAEDIDVQRKRVVAELVNGGLLRGAEV